MSTETCDNCCVETENEPLRLCDDCNAPDSAHVSAVHLALLRRAESAEARVKELEGVLRTARIWPSDAALAVEGQSKLPANSDVWTFEEVCWAIDRCGSGHAKPDNRVPCDFKSLKQWLPKARAALSGKDGG